MVNEKSEELRDGCQKLIYLSKFTIGGWNSVQPTNLKSLEALQMSVNGSEFQAKKDLSLRTRCMEQHCVRTDLNVERIDASL